jgi:urease accessory protein
MLHVFRPIPTVREVCRADALPPAATVYGRDTITLGWEERLKTRVRRRSDGGVEFGTVLDRGSILRQGDCFVLDEPPVVIAVVEAAEPVFVIEPASASDWGRYAYQIGNSHQPLMLTETAIICPDVPGMEQVLTYHAVPFRRDTCAFTPIASSMQPHDSDHRHQR